MLKRRSVWSPKTRTDGLRILTTRFRGRGLSASTYNVWMPSLGPSEHLLKSFRGGRMSWARFARAYQQELFEEGSLGKKNLLIKNHGQKFTLRLVKELARAGHVTLMCHCSDDEPHCHTRLLLNLLRSSRV